MLILASASPRRLDLLRQIGLEPLRTVPAEVDETPRKREAPRDLALRLACAKAAYVAADNKGFFILAADTVVACGRRILDKAENADDVKAFLSLLSGRRHKVIGGISVITPDGSMKKRIVETVVQFKKMSSGEIADYAACGEGIGKAGGYAIQGRAAAHIKFIGGSYSNVVGLSLYDTMQMLGGGSVFTKMPPESNGEAGKVKRSGCTD